MLIIDPYIFLPNPRTGNYDLSRINAIKNNIRRLIQICRHYNWKVQCETNGFKNLELKVVRRLTEEVSDPELNIALTTLRREHIEKICFSSQNSARTWGIRPIYGNLQDASNIEFANFVTKSALHCLQNQGEAYIFTQENEGRNIIIHAVENTFLVERTRWRVYFSNSGLSGARAVSCVTSLRNLVVPWTSRYDSGLPDKGTYAFTPPQNWHLRDTLAVGTMTSKPVYFDESGNGWARPNTPGSPYHWDVYLVDTAWKSALRVNQINITKHGAPSDQGIPGEIHHVPRAKRSVVGRRRG